MATEANEEDLLRSVALQNAQSIHQARRLAEAELRKQSEWLRVTLASIGDAVISTDGEAQVTFMNGVAESLTGWGQAEALGHPLSEVFCIIDEQSRQPVENPAVRALREGCSVGLPNPTILIAKDGAERPIDDRAAPIRSSAGEVLGAVLVFRNVTERKQAERVYQESQASSERQRRLYEAILSNTPDFAYVFDLKHRFIYANAGLLKMWGRTWETAIGKNCLELGYEPWHAALHDREIDQVVATKQPIRGEVPFVGTLGRRIYDYIFVPVLGANGEVEAIVGTTRDITDRQQAEETRARLAAIVDSSDDAIVSKTLEGIVTSWNAGAQRLFGYQASEIVGQSIVTIIPPDRQSEETGILERLRRKERVEHFETVRMSKTGQRIEVSLSISPIFDSAGRIIGASKIARDITKRKQVEDTLRRVQAQLANRADELERAVADRTTELRATNEYLEAFVYSIAHDLRAPLRSMTSFSQLLLEDHASGLNEEGKSYLKRIQAASEFLDKLLLDLLAYGRTTSTEMKLLPVQVKKVWGTALFQTALQAEQSGAHIEAVGPLPVVLAHETTLGQCLANLLSNAMKFVAPGVQPRIRLRSEELAPQNGHGATIRLWLEDNGIGIAPEHQNRVFRVFERLHGGRYDGTGIGLSIVRKGIERMGGRMGIESEVGQGSRFWIELPKADLV